MGRFVDRAGKRYGKLLAIEKTDKRDASGAIVWRCRCDCGNIVDVSGTALRKQKSCGCQSVKLNDLTGKVFGRLTVLKRIGYKETGHTSMWECVCACGNKTTASSNDLKRGNVTSCGCYRKETTHNRSYKHGVGNESRLFRIWSGIKSRCYNKHDANYKRYGGRGITMCQEWLDSFLVFQKWAVENGYDDALSIDRIDVNGQYCPENCRWATALTQSNNRRTNAYFSCDGATHTASEWARITGTKPATIIARRGRGWTDEECIKGKTQH